MSKVPIQEWKKDSKFKLKARMQEVNAIEEYEDVRLHDTFYKMRDVGQIVTDGEIMNVIGKLQIV